MIKLATSKFGDYVNKALENIRIHDEYEELKKDEPTLHVPNVANVLVFAYEQLRIASENTEDHLLLQSAIRRYYGRVIFQTWDINDESLGTELIIELTQAQYLRNDSISLDVIKDIDELTDKFFELFKQIENEKVKSTKKKYARWLLDILSVRVEQLLTSSVRNLSFVHVAHHYLTENIDYTNIIDKNDKIDPEKYPSLLYIAVHKALLKSDDANARCGLLDLNRGILKSKQDINRFNDEYDYFTSSKSMINLIQFVTKNSAPFKIIKDYLFLDNSRTKVTDINNSDLISVGISNQIDITLENIKKARKIAVVKSIFFLLITKAIIGLLVEIPYDLVVTGSVVVVPLIFNLLVPPAFLTLTALTFKIPGRTNKVALENCISSMLYTDLSQKLALRYRDKSKSRPVFNIVFGLVFAGAVYLMITRLAGLGFNVVQELLFFIFFSTAAFLGYRITLQIKEIEYVQTNQGFVALVRDLLYSPFIFLGKNISYRFSKLNLIARVLDVLVDLPLKTFTKLLRQWIKFMNEKKDDLI